MAIVVSREGVSFTVEDPTGDSRTEAARAMAEISRRWGPGGSASELDGELSKIITSARLDSKTRVEELILMESKSKKIQLMEELAASFRAMEDEADDVAPRFQGTGEAALGMLREYSASLGCRVEIS